MDSGRDVVIGRVLIGLLGALMVGLAAVGAQDDDPAAEVTPTLETEPLPESGDSADDVAIWIHPSDPSLSTVIGADKRGGLAVYDLEGRQIQYTFEHGRLNNVDLRYNFTLAGEPSAIVAASNRRGDSIAIFRVDPAPRELVDVAAREIETEIDIYGLCLYHSALTGAYFAFVNGEDGEVQQWELFDDGTGTVDAALVREFTVESQPEGCVADDEQGYLYLGEEDVAIWRFDAEPDRPADPVEIARVSNDGPLVDDIEGLTLYYTADGGGYLIASSQGSDEFVVYSRGEAPEYVGRFAIVSSDAVDGASGTDGIDVTNAPLGDAFPEGLFVAQDGRNTNPDANQNFKLVSWGEIARQLDLTIDLTWDPRAVGAEEGTASDR